MRSCYPRGAPLRAAIYFEAQFNYPDDVTTGITVASYCLGCLVGCALSFAIGDMLGRRKMIWLAMALIVVGATLQASAYSLAHLIVGRVITGFGTGIDSSTIPMYQSELSKKENRGRLVSWEIFFIGIGIATAYWIDYGFSFVDSEASWRTPVAIQLIFAIVVIFVVWGLPESPRWLAKRGRDAEAEEVLCAVFDTQPNDPFIVEEMRAIRAAVALEKTEGKKGYGSIFQKDILKTRRRVALAWFALFMNQLSGINLVVYYMPTVLLDIGQSRNNSLLIAGGVQLMFPLGNLVPAFFLDRMGRRPTMLWGCGLLSFCMVMITILLSFGTDNFNTSSASIAFFYLYMLIFGGTVNVVPWVYGPEILPLEARTRGTAISVSSHWLWNFFIVMISPVLINRIGFHTYIVFAILLACFIPIVCFFYPETSNISLEDIDKIFLPEHMHDSYTNQQHEVFGGLDSSKGEINQTEKA
ncbi:unnamed protein product [Zymoseptoria tritici ST99CH_1A5]|uniref:Major facilitator superfamily (MFS) profile domain-containing protein n=1 Tax=Zymoseptoria tritici ST99CH_1A5 TaxID=1276529 RepID=A0A1Y6LEX3_ZYMTR|nr:unnamed protein product [Zymoseptoria tritici ST99CH_1A5]